MIAAAIRSIEEWAASDSMPSEPVSMPGDQLEQR